MLRAAAIALVILGGSFTFAAQEKPPQPPPPDDLGERLIRQVKGEPDQDIMDAIIHLMDGVARQLQVDFDTGEKTRTMQKDLLEKLDEAIKTAAAQRRPRRSKPQPSTSDKRRMAQRLSKEGEQTGSAKPEDAKTSGTSTSLTAGSVTEEVPSGGALREVRRSWGRLPHRERDEIIQGVDERFLERYRTWIERYYRALQESDE